MPARQCVSQQRPPVLIAFQQDQAARWLVSKTLSATRALGITRAPTCETECRRRSGRFEGRAQRKAPGNRYLRPNRRRSFGASIGYSNGNSCYAR